MTTSADQVTTVARKILNMNREAVKKALAEATRDLMGKKPGAKKSLTFTVDSKFNLKLQGADDGPGGGGDTYAFTLTRMQEGVVFEVSRPLHGVIPQDTAHNFDIGKLSPKGEKKQKETSLSTPEDRLRDKLESRLNHVLKYLPPSATHVYNSSPSSGVNVRYGDGVGLVTATELTQISSYPATDGWRIDTSKNPPRLARQLETVPTLEEEKKATEEQEQKRIQALQQPGQPPYWRRLKPGAPRLLYLGTAQIMFDGSAVEIGGGDQLRNSNGGICFGVAPPSKAVVDPTNLQSHVGSAVELTYQTRSFTSGELHYGDEDTFAHQVGVVDRFPRYHTEVLLSRFYVNFARKRADYDGLFVLSSQANLFSHTRWHLSVTLDRSSVYGIISRNLQSGGDMATELLTEMQRHCHLTAAFQEETESDENLNIYPANNPTAPTGPMTQTGRRQLGLGIYTASGDAEDWWIRANRPDRVRLFRELLPTFQMTKDSIGASLRPESKRK
ncbi:hypothetical protein [Streptomyces sp. NPDC047028]|uniref:hypothetical protein n=1 Tax=Streptomyces sp. NPDC047028 TaxID=3155793 RepID=UPI0033E93F4F